MTELPNEAGSASASTPGSPPNAGLRWSSSKAMAPRSSSGRWTGEIWMPVDRNASAYSKRIRPEPSSTTAPTCWSKIRTSAAARTSAIATRALLRSLRAARQDAHRRDLGLGQERLEAVERSIEAQEPDEREKR